jgi:hypothetical protein
VADERWVILDSKLAPAEVVGRLQGEVFCRKRLWPRLGGAPVVVSTTTSGFVARAYGFWKSYLVQGSVEPVEEGSRIVLRVGRAERLERLRATAVGALALTGVVGFGLPIGALALSRKAVLLWGGAALGIGVLAGLALWVAREPCVSERDMDRLTRHLRTLLDARGRA